MPVIAAASSMTLCAARRRVPPRWTISTARKIFPSERGGYNFQCIPVGFGSEERRKDVPKEWWGLSKANLQRLTGVKTAKFCHNKGFIGGAMTFEDTMKMVKLAMER